MSKRKIKVVATEVSLQNESMHMDIEVINIPDSEKVRRVVKTIKDQRKTIDELRDTIRANTKLLKLAGYHLALGHENEETEGLKYANFQIQEALKLINKTGVDVEHHMVSNKTPDHD